MVENIDENMGEINGGKVIGKIVKKIKEKNVTVGDVVSIPLRVPMYIIGANIAGLMLGAYEGFGDVWYTSHPEKRWAKSQKSGE